MLTFTLYWGIYPQWTRQFATCQEAIEEARKYAKDRHSSISEFRLIQLVEVTLKE